MILSGATGAPGERFVDLHVHSTASDGVLAPAAVIAAAKAAGLSAIALTDHDTLAGLGEARAAAAGSALRVIPGVELSALVDGRELHILGLHIERIEPMEAYLAAFRESRQTRAEMIVEKLNTLGIAITMADVAAQAGTGVLGRPHVARALVQRGAAVDFKDAFDKWLSHGRPAYVEKLRLTAADAIRVIHETGGLAVFAHPAQEGNHARLTALSRLGLDGVEIRHPSHSPEDIARIGSLARELGLLESGGSDWHGATQGPRTLGNMRVPWAVLDRQEARLASRRAAALA